MLCVRVPSDPGKPKECYMEEHLLYYCCRRMELCARGLAELWKCWKDSCPASLGIGRTSLHCTALPSSHLSQGTSLFYKHQLQEHLWLHPKLMDKARKIWVHRFNTILPQNISLGIFFYGFYHLFGSGLLLWVAGKAGISRDRHLDPISAKPCGTRCWINVNRKTLGII